MEIELKYAEALEENNIQAKDLPEDARTGIREINKALSFIKMGEAKGKKISPDAIKKIKAMDKWVHYEILDFIQDTDRNEDEIPYESEDVEDEITSKQSYDNDEREESNIQQVQNKGDGAKINTELSNLYKENKNILTLDEIKKYAPNTYDAIFDVYEDGEQNGVETKSFSLIEFEKQRYKLTKI